MNIKYLLTTVFLVFLSTSIAATNLVDEDKIVAIVNSDVITQSELNKKILAIKKHMEMSGKSKPSASSLRKQAIDELIDISLQLQMAKKNNIKIDDKELDGVVANIAKNNGLSIEQLKENLLKQEGISFKEFRSELRKQGLISRIQQQILGRELNVSEAEVKSVLNNPPKMGNQSAQYNVVDVLFETVDNAAPARKKLTISMANELLAKLKKNIDIDVAVKEQEKKHKGQKILVNDLGWRRIVDFPDLFIDKIEGMKKGQVIGPIEAPNGFHLLKLLNARGEAKLTKEQAYEVVYHRKLMKKLKPWLKELKSKAYIKIIK